MGLSLFLNMSMLVVTSKLRIMLLRRRTLSGDGGTDGSNDCATGELLFLFVDSPYELYQFYERLPATNDQNPPSELQAR